MKKTFPEYFKLTEKELTDLWNTADLVFDANILLNIYRYSEATRNELYEIIKQLSDRVWISYQASLEFLKNRLGVIHDQVKAYDETINNLKSIEDNFKDINKHPFIGEKTLSNLLKSFEEAGKDLNKRKEEYNKLASEDAILDKITELFDGKIGDASSEEELKEICKAGDKRYKENVPPGYKDNAKDGIHKYGDFILWSQLLKHSAEKKKNIIFITDDKKEDWWRIHKGKTIGPRPELISEFKKKTDNQFYMYHADRFMEFANKYLKQQVKEEAIKEIKEQRHKNYLVKGFQLRGLEDIGKGMDRNLIMKEALDRAFGSSNLESIGKEMERSSIMRNALESALENPGSEILRRELERSLARHEGLERLLESVGFSRVVKKPREDTNQDEEDGINKGSAG